MVTIRSLFSALLNLWLVAAAAGLSTGMALGAEVSAALNTNTVPAGEGATLTITVRNGRAGEPQIPQVKDFIVKGGQRGHQMSFYNGQTTSATTFSYAVGSLTPGEYTIPPITINVDGQDMQTAPLKLTVTPSANQAPSGIPQNSGNEPKPGTDDFGSLSVELASRDRKHVWVGEIAPVRIKAWLPADARINLTSSLQPEGQAFTLHNVSGNPQQAIEERDGKQFRTLTWYGGLSAAKAGSYPPDLKIKATVAVRDPNTLQQRRRSRTNDPFDDPFFDRVFAPMIQKDVVLSSAREGNSIEVRALPKEGRPEDFSGAVGKFTLDSVAIPESWQTGEPQQISTAIGGEGNFNLLKQPALVPEGPWKSYPGQSDFAPKDIASFSGTQTFRFNAVAQRPGTHEAALTFSFFDPDAGTYSTLRSPARMVRVVGEPVVDSRPPQPTQPAQAPEPSDRLAPWKATAGTPLALMPPGFRPAFRNLLYTSAGVAFAGAAAAWVRRRLLHPARRAKLAQAKTLHLALAEADSRASHGDAAGFFEAARRALQFAFAPATGKHPESITLHDISSLLPGDAPALRLFHEADRFAYSAERQAGAIDLGPWRQALHAAVNALQDHEPTSAAAV